MTAPSRSHHARQLRVHPFLLEVTFLTKRRCLDDPNMSALTAATSCHIASSAALPAGNIAGRVRKELFKLASSSLPKPANVGCSDSWSKSNDE